MSRARLAPLARGVLSYLPGLGRILSTGTGGTNSARYCYSVWMRHLMLASAAGVKLPIRRVLELGPGDSIGVGLSALLSGTDSYWGLDWVRHANRRRNLEILEELEALFRNRAPVPGDDEFPLVAPSLSDYSFPSRLLPDSLLSRTLAADRLGWIRSALDGGRGSDTPIHYLAPWDDWDLVPPESVDFLVSQAVLEHVRAPAQMYAAMSKWVKEGGMASHEIDFKSHGVATTWNGHWALSDFTWRLVSGRRRYLLNREPASTHLALLKANGFEVVTCRPVRSASGIERSELAPRFRSMSDHDLTIRGMYVLAVRTRRPASRGPLE